MHSLSCELIKHFFTQYPRLDFLFQSAFAEKRLLPAERYTVFSETTAFIRLFPAFAYQKGCDPFKGKPLFSLVRNAIRFFDPFAHRAYLQEYAVKEQSAVVLTEVFALPLFFTESLLRTYTPDFVETFLKRSVMERPLFLRKIGNRELSDPAVMPAIAPVAGIPGAYLFSDKILDFTAPWYKEGIFTIQDLSGQLVCLLINPKPGNKVLDACAGNGGKSIVLADLMQGKGELTALHQKQREQLELKQRLVCHNLQNVRQILAAAETNFTTLFDIILTDVPCSGSGVIRRNPDLIYRLLSLDFQKFAANQLEILKTYSRFLKPGGKLVYTTCSVIDKENAQVIAVFLKECNGEFTENAFLTGKNYYQLSVAAAAIQTLGGSADVNCDGFFIAGLTRNG